MLLDIVLAEHEKLKSKTLTTCLNMRAQAQGNYILAWALALYILEKANHPRQN